MEVRHLRENPGALFGFTPVDLSDRHDHQLQRASTSPKSSRRYAARVRPGTVPGRRLSIHCAASSASAYRPSSTYASTSPVGHQVVRHLPIDSPGFLQRPAELVLAEQHPRLELVGFEVARRQASRFRERQAACS
jgi:hypothetical protein